jgi:hypothetical protein
MLIIQYNIIERTGNKYVMEKFCRGFFWHWKQNIVKLSREATVEFVVPENRE